jgi:hypothetical protein
MVYSQIFHQIIYFPSEFYFFENFKISDNNIISVELVQLLQYYQAGILHFQFLGISTHEYARLQCFNVHYVVVCVTVVKITCRLPTSWALQNNDGCPSSLTCP